MLYSERAFSSVRILPVHEENKGNDSSFKRNFLCLIKIYPYQHKSTFDFPRDNLYPFQPRSSLLNSSPTARGESDNSCERGDAQRKLTVFAASIST